MASWFRRQRPRVEAPTLTPRDTAAGALRVDLAELAPAPDSFLGQCAALHLVFIEQLTTAMANAPRVADKDALARVAGIVFERYRGLTAELERLQLDKTDVMTPHLDGVEEFKRRTQGGEWHEQVASAHVTIGFLTDFWMRLAAGLPAELRGRVTAALSTGDLDRPMHRILERAIAANPTLASRLALWCRRLVGDTMLQARSALVLHGDRSKDEAQIEPVFTELIAEHTRRMDRLGLTA
ncbi:ferritin-like fold-containing protein [Microcella sp.]|uniref:ferritin-like fold-containing protein n=1 Tax=Microcella sp. TaxID=1913979 RepID=UPI003918EEC4